MEKNILSVLDNVKSVMIAGHTRPDGDCVGSCMAVMHYIKDNYPDTEVCVRLETVPESYRVIPGTEDIITQYEDDSRYELFIAVDVSEINRLAAAGKYFQTAQHTICIDHHISNPCFADDNLVIADASSTCEVLAGIMDFDKISYNTAFALYVGIICDSGVFKYESTSSRTMNIAGKLMEKGIPYYKIIDQVFYQRSYTQCLMLGRALSDSCLLLDGRLIVSVIKRSDMRSINAENEDLEGIVEQMRLTRGVETALFASENADGGFKYSLRSINKVDVAAIAGRFGGGGHVRAAGFSSDEDPEQIIEAVAGMVSSQLDD